MPKRLQQINLRRQQKNMKEIFLEKINLYYKGDKDKILDQKLYNEIIEKLKDHDKEDVKYKPTSEQVLLSKKYKVIEYFGEPYLIKRRHAISDPIMRYVPIEDMFEIIDTYHKKFGHGEWQKILTALNRIFVISKMHVDVFMSCCDLCGLKYVKDKVNKKKKKEFNSQTNLDIICMEETPDDLFNYILVYVDSYTSFTILKPLIRVCPMEISMELLKIVLDFGPPNTFGITGKFKDVFSLAISNLQSLCSSLIIEKELVSETKEHTESLEHIVSRIRKWISDNGSTSWALGCHVVQWQLNNHIDHDFNQAPLEGTSAQSIDKTPFYSVFRTSPYASNESPKASCSDTDSTSDNISENTSQYDSLMEDDIDIDEIKIEDLDDEVDEPNIEEKVEVNIPPIEVTVSPEVDLEPPTNEVLIKNEPPLKLEEDNDNY